MLKQYAILKPATEFEDDVLLQHRYGLTDIAKMPRPFGHEPSPEEYRTGAHRILELIRVHTLKVTVFVYKRVLDKIIKFEFGITERSTYGFNQDLEHYFGCRVFAFPLPGTSCTREQATAAMQKLATACAEFTNATSNHSDINRPSKPQQRASQGDSQPHLTDAARLQGPSRGQN
jgi:hypothetical protein